MPGSTRDTIQTYPQCPNICRIEIALRAADYMAIILRPVIRRLFKRCKNLECVNLATAGDLTLSQSLFTSLNSRVNDMCNVQAKTAGRPEKPMGYVEFVTNAMDMLSFFHSFFFLCFCFCVYTCVCFDVCMYDELQNITKQKMEIKKKLIGLPDEWNHRFLCLNCQNYECMHVYNLFYLLLLLIFVSGILFAFAFVGFFCL